MANSKYKTLYFLQIEKTVEMMNKDLAELDNGGYEVHYDQPPDKLSTSDVKVGRKYKDRFDNNRKKVFQNSNILAHALRFQQAVQNMKNRKDQDVR